jgi:Bacterial PH domain
MRRLRRFGALGSWSRRLLLASAVLSTGFGLALWRGGPRLTLVNSIRGSGLRVDYPASRGAGAAAVAIGAALLAATGSRAWIRVPCALLAGYAALAGVDLLTYRLEADAATLAARGAFGSTVLRWAQVRRVESGPSRVVVWGPDETQIRIDTADFMPEQRASLDRSIARRVREGQAGSRDEPR